MKYVVNPLRSMTHHKNCIINTFKCTKIFLNIDQIACANEKFLNDLLQSHDFGSICQKHVSFISFIIKHSKYNSVNVDGKL